MSENNSTKHNTLPRKILQIMLHSIVIILFIGIVACAIMFIRGYSIKDIASTSAEKELLGIELIEAMYNFDSPYQLDAQMSIVKSITTEDVFNDLTIDNEERTILTYFKFKDCGVKVKIISSSENYVYYKLQSDVIDKNRTFIMFFSVNQDGLIDWVEEAECVKFIDTLY